MASPINPNQNRNPADTSNVSTGNSSTHLPTEDRKASDAAAPLKPNPEKASNINQSLKTLGASGAARKGDEHTYLAYLPNEIREDINKKVHISKLKEYFNQLNSEITLLATRKNKAEYVPESGSVKIMERSAQDSLFTPESAFYYLIAYEIAKNSDLIEAKELVKSIENPRVLPMINIYAGNPYRKYGALFKSAYSVENVLNLELLLKAGLSFDDYHKLFPDRPRQPLKPNDPEIELIKSRIFALIKLKSMVDTDEGKNSLKATIDVALDKIGVWFPLQYETEFAQKFLFTNDLNILIDQYTSLLPRSQNNNSHDSKYTQDYTYQNMYNKIEGKFK